MGSGLWLGAVGCLALPWEAGSSGGTQDPLNELHGTALETPAEPPQGPPQAGVRAVGYRAQNLPGDSSSGLEQGSGPALSAELSSQKRLQDHRVQPCTHLQAWERKLFSGQHGLPLTSALLIHLSLCVGTGCGS